MIACLSDAYFADAACGRQWRIFTSRRTLVPFPRSGPEPPTEAAALIPLLWSPCRRPLPENVPPVHDPVGAPTGVRDLMRTSGDHGAYIDLLAALADRVLNAQRLALRPWPESDVAHMRPAFGTTARRPASRGPETAGRAGTHRVAINHVAADRPWANWLRGLLVDAGYRVDLVDHDPRGSLAASSTRETRSDAEVVVLSRNWTAAARLPVGSGGTAGAPCGPRAVWVQVDHDPPPGSGALRPIPLYGLDDAMIQRLLTALRSPPT
ncbi:toll/interleukin-1 receptor domain-containing protein [Nocardiopsis sp. CNR-923]|uniref:toll/interleukin-1 receptor domain-containing protein n=1 Tax=Nocardiopsis sp. CNR-923 TaxID=1904965 RepID=UPI001180353D|nr:toll/interleukin-1 receptor domain-containing protein [Nocardiopsis sp. CNR-923]